eukprot:Skav219683  [mRNA]  locus=scaffold817:72948:78818:+ [translate_table: standard]
MKIGRALEKWLASTTFWDSSKDWHTNYSTEPHRRQGRPYDNSTVGPYAAGRAQWNATWEYEVLRDTLGSIRHLLQCTSRRFEFSHLKSHNGHPWSEAVDSLAKAVAKGVILAPHLPSTVAEILRHKMLSTAWMQFCPHPNFPRPHELRSTFAKEGPFHGQQEDVTWWTPTHHHEATHVAVSLCLATANVLTLDAGSARHQSQGLMQLGRIASLQAQFEAEHIRIAGLQETRTQGSCVRHSCTHLVYQSGATCDGTHGCELWLSKNLPYAQHDGSSWCFTASHVQVVSTGPRHLIAVIRAPYCHLRVAVVHAPHKQSTNPTPDEWWQFFAGQVAKTPVQLPLVMLGDMNARIGKVVTEAVSDVHAEDETETGHLMHSFMLEHRLWAPSTFESCHEGDSYTWVSHDGVKHRLDYVLLPQAWKSMTILSHVAYGLDLMTANHDHFAVIAHISMQVASSHQAPMKVRFDVRKCVQEEAKQKFRDFLCSLPPIPWHFGVGLHAELLTSWVQHGAQLCFPFDRQLPRQRYMSDNTWTIVRLRKSLLKIQQASDKQLSLCRYKKFFQLWKWQVLHGKLQGILRYGPVLGLMLRTHSQQWLHVCEQVILQCRSVYRWSFVHRRRLHYLARKMSRQDRVDQATNLAKQFHEAAGTKDSKAIYAALRPLLGQTFRKGFQGFKPLPAVQRGDGFLAQDHGEAQEVWRSHFAQQEHGCLVTVSQLQELAQLQAPRYSDADLIFDMSLVPRLSDIEHYILKAKRNKCPGSDGLPSEIYQLDPTVFAKLLHPLFSKCTIRCTEPLRWKGGDICALPKVHQPAHQVEQFRSILLADFSSKIYHGLIRKQLLPSFAQYRHAMQAGGVPGLSTDMLNLYVQAFAQFCKHRNRSSASLFVDIKQAFYRTVRPLLIFRQHITEHELASFFGASGLSVALFHEFVSHVRAPAAVDRAKVGSHQKAQVHSLLATTWFRLRNVDESLTCTMTGTRPGDSIADILFAFLMGRFLHELRELFIQHNLHFTMKLDWLPIGPFQDEDMDTPLAVQACWVDDLVLLLESETPRQLLDKVQTAMQLTHDLATTYGITLNYGRNKTSALIALRGAQVNAIWNEVLHHDAVHPKLQFWPTSSQVPLYLDIVPDYVYLGVLLDQQGHPAAEVKRRFLSLQAPTKLLNKGVFRSKHLPFDTKKMLFQSLTMSKLTFSSGAWQPMRIHTAQSWITQVMALYRKLAPTVKPGPSITHLDVVADCMVIHPHMILFVQRMSLFDRIMQSEMIELFAILQLQPRDTGWFSLICDDLIRTASLHNNEEVSQAATNFNVEWLAQHSFQHPKVFTRLGKTVVKHYKGYLQLWKSFRKFQKKFTLAAMTHGISWSEHQVPIPRGAAFVCDQCTASFPTYGALCTHALKKHNQWNVVQRYAINNVCRACLKCYDSRQQLINHLKYYKTGCVVKLILTTPPLTDADLEEVLAEARQLHKTHRNKQRKAKHTHPVTRVHGPQLPWPWQRRQDFAQVETQDGHMPDEESQAAWVWQGVEALASSDAALLFDVLMRFPYHGRLAQMLITRFVTMFQPDLEHHEAEKYLLLQDVMVLWQEANLHPPCRAMTQISLDHAGPLLAQLRAPVHGTSQEPESYDVRRAATLQKFWEDFDVVANLAEQIQRERNKQYVFPTPPQIPVWTNPIYLYVFSGRRRKGDYQEHLEQILAERSLTGRVLLIDLALSEDHNVYDDCLVATLVNMIKHGAIAALLIAPPCETWSNARTLECDQGSCPRPLRTNLQPLCISGLTHSELQQLQISNYLLFVAIELMLHCAFTSTPAIMEHPMEPQPSSAPSIWRLPWLRKMEDAGVMSRTLLWQARFGAVSAKPTHFMTCGIKKFRQQCKPFEREVRWDELQVLRGKDHSGAWRTAKGKEYPSDLNRALATVHIDSSFQRARNLLPDPSIVEDVETMYSKLYAGNCVLHEQVMAPDYHGSRLLSTMD